MNVPQYLAYGEGDTKTFTQDEVNTFIAEEKRKWQGKETKWQQEQKDLVTQLEALRKNETLTKDERDQLQSRIETLQAQYMTTEERARQAAEATQKRYDEERKQLTQERDIWRQKHQDLTITTAIASAAMEHEAISFEQIHALLSSRAKLVETLNEDGKPTGQYVPHVILNVTDSKGKPVALDLNITDAVKHMKELPQYANLFKTTAKSGIGGTGSATSGKVDLAKIARENPAEYRRLRKERPELFANL